MLTYWNKVKGARYYEAVRQRVIALAPASVLDVGTGPTLYLNEWPVAQITAADVEVPACWRKLAPHIRRVQITGRDLLDRVAPHEGVTCLQTLEHVPEGARQHFIEDLFGHATAWVIITVPFRWTKSKYANHVGIDEDVLIRWCNGRIADEREIVEEPTGARRLLAFFRIR